MKKGIHQNYVDTKVICACGNTFTVKSTKDEMHVEVCNECHPFFKDGKSSLITSRAGRVEKFNRKYGFNKKAE